MWQSKQPGDFPPQHFLGKIICKALHRDLGVKRGGHGGPHRGRKPFSVSNGGAGVGAGRTPPRRSPSRAVSLGAALTRSTLARVQSRVASSVPVAVFLHSYYGDSRKTNSKHLPALHRPILISATMHPAERRNIFFLQDHHTHSSEQKFALTPQAKSWVWASLRKLGFCEPQDETGMGWCRRGLLSLHLPQLLFMKSE